MSEEKIIARRNKLIEWTKTQDIRCTPFCETINENINSINYLLHKLQQKDNIIKEVREMREYLSNKYYEMGEEVDMGVIIEHLDRILDKAGSENNGS